MNNERKILLNSIAGIINMQPTNDIYSTNYEIWRHNSGEVASKIYLWLF